MGSRAHERAAAAGAAAGGGAPGGAAVRLDQGTYSDEIRERTLTKTPRGFRGYRAKLIDYGGGLAEAGFAFIGEFPRAKGIRGESKDREENEKRAGRRARNRLRQLVLAAQLDHLLTLTYRDNVEDFAQSSADLAKFERKVRATYPAFQFVAVPERQKRGAWHWHLAVRGWQDVAFLRSTWQSIVGEGNIDVEPPRHGSGNPRLALCQYLSKYLSKEFGGPGALNRHRFRASRGIDVPLRFVRLGTRTMSGALEATRGLVKVAAGIVGYHFVHDEYGAGVVFSWDLNGR